MLSRDLHSHVQDRNFYLFAVHPDHQGQGRGAALLRHVEQDLREAGARVLLIET